MEHDDLLKICDELTEYAELEGSELGDSCKLLIQVAYFHSYFTEEFQKSLELEIIAQLNHFKKNSRIVEKVLNPIIYKVKELEWDY